MQMQESNKAEVVKLTILLSRVSCSFHLFEAAMKKIKEYTQLNIYGQTYNISMYI